MARPLSVTDDQILEATERVVAKFGAHRLTISQVARDVGLSRAAITLRFTGTDTLKRRVMERMVNRFAADMAAMRIDHGSSGLLAIAEMLGGKLKGREHFSNFWVRFTSNIHDPILLKMEERRGDALRSLIASVMPETVIGKEEAVDLFMALMTGSMMNWQVGDHPDAGMFLRERAQAWIRLAGIPLDEQNP